MQKLRLKDYQELLSKNTLDDEEWVELYGILASNKGRIITKRKGLHHGYIAKDQYGRLVYQCRTHRKRGDRVHRLVAEAFIDNPLNLETVNHIDENTLNNDVSNLEWLSRLDNINYGTRNQRIGKSNSINVLATKGDFEKEYSSMKSCELDLGIGSGGVSLAIKHHRPVKGYTITKL